MKKLKKKASDELEKAENMLESLDKVFGKLPPYKVGQKAGTEVSNLIDKVVDKIFPK